MKNIITKLIVITTMVCFGFFHAHTEPSEIGYDLRKPSVLEEESYTNSIQYVSSLFNNNSNVFIDKDVEQPKEILLGITQVNPRVLHIITHGKQGALLINKKWYSGQELADFIKSKLNSEIEYINIYGCEFAKGKKGLAAVHYLETHLGVSVSASTNITGKGGDWIMEVGSNDNVIDLPNYNASLQTNSDLEFATIAGDGNPTGNGPLQTTTINFIKNTDNPTANTFTTYSPTLSSIFTLSNQIYTPSYFPSGYAANFGYASAGATKIFNPLGAAGSPSDSYFTASGASAGTGISSANTAAANYAVNLFILTSPLQAAGIATNTRNHMADLTITFNRPVNNPILHFSGLGGAFGTVSSANGRQGYSAEFDFLSANVPVSFSKLSGTSAFTISSTQITNNAAIITASGADSGSGSVLVTGNGITTITLRVYIRGDGGGANWATSSTSTTNADGLMMSVSVLESDLAVTKTVNNTTPLVGSNVVFTVAATNNGPSTSTNTNVTDLLPTGYTYVSSTATTGTYNSTTGLWSIGSMNNAATETLTITATALGTGNYTNTATITGDIGDSNTSNNSASAVTVPVPDTDGDGIFDDVDIDDDNDGILDAVESPSCYYAGSEVKSLITSISSQFPSTENFGLLYNGIIETTAATAFNFTTAQTTITNPVGSKLFTIEFAQAVELGSLVLSNNISSTAAARALLFGSNNGVTYTQLTSTASNIQTTTGTTFTVDQNQNKYKYYQIQTSVAGAIAVTDFMGEITPIVANNYAASSYPKSTCTEDTDGDGITNDKDLDSDGDGCPDAKEASVTGTLTAAPDNMGVTAGTASAVAASPYGANGLSDGLENIDLSTANTVYVSTYNIYALSEVLNVCADTDGDSIGDLVDIDDDNDGVLDAEEAPACYYSSDEATTIQNISSQFTSPDPFTTLYDGSAALTFNFNPYAIGAISAGDNIFTITYPTPVPLSSVIVSNRIASTNVGRGKLFGSLDGVSWTPLSINNVNLFGTATTNPVNFPVEQNQGNYLYYQIQFTVPSPLVAANTIGEITSVIASNYAPSAYPKASCTVDTDGDGITNEKDLDSDGDGCPDAKEANVPGTLNSAPANMGIASGTLNSVAPSPYGANGLSNGLENNDTIAASINYTSTYASYAIYIALNICADTDGDTIGDLVDIDDDNDGVLDAIEAPSCYYTAAEASKIVSVSSELNTYLPSSQNVNYVIDGVATTINAFALGQNWAGKELYRIQATSELIISELQVDLSTWALSNSGSTFRLQGSKDATNWTDLSGNITSTATTGVLQIPNTIVPNGRFTYFRLVGVSGNSGYGGVEEIRIIVSQNYEPSYDPKPICNLDTDGDGITNDKDLDSDGDGCPDAKEAGVNGTFLVAPASMGITAGTANAVATGPYGLNGLADAVETPAESGLITYTNYYTVFATTATLNACDDTDNDGTPDLVDIDDDNDGIIDALEAPSCYYTLPEVLALYPPMATFSDLLWRAGYSYTNTTDGSTSTYSELFPPSTQSITGKTIIEYTLPVSLSVNSLLLDMRNLGITQTATSGTLKLQGWDGSAWVDLSVAQSSTVTSATETFTNTLQPNGLFNKLRLYGVSGVAYYARINEVSITINNFSSSGFNKPTCSVDTDGDGITNDKDLDSDGDGCPDAKESGVPGTLNTTTSTETSGIPEGTANAIAAAPYGTNGLANSLENNDTKLASTSFQSTYTSYAIANILNLCTDTDGDSINDIDDIDDDNDGILDAIEAPSCYYQESEIVAISATASDLNWSSDYTLAADGNVATFTDLFPVINQPITDKVIIELTMLKSLPINSLVLNMGNLSINQTASSGTVKLQGWNGNTWLDLSTTRASTVTSAIETFVNTLQTNVLFTKVRLYGVSGTAYYARIKEASITLQNYAASAQPKPTCSVDTDGDGITNDKDLDSDGDGCPDALESGVTGTLTDAPAGLGIIEGTPNAVAASPYGTNGLSNGLENNDTQSAITSFNSTYYSYALISTISVCTDTDGDGINDIIDIDDDNDGILDAIEAPSCYYTLAEMTNPASVTTDLSSTINTALAYDNNLTSSFYFSTAISAATALYKSVFEITPKRPQVANAIILNLNSATSCIGPLSSTATITAQGWTGWSWVDLQTYTASPAVVSTIQTFAFTNTTAYLKYRLYEAGPSGVNITTNYINEITLGLPSPFSPSANPKATCTSDFDGDGINNQLDLDSDNDGCLDAIEGGASITNSQLVTAGGTVTVGTGSTASNLNLCGGTTCVDANGLPQLTTPADYSNTTGQTIGTSEDATINSCYCYKPAITSGAILDTKHGITALARAGVAADNWPMVRKGAWTALEAKTKGFVLNRVAFSDADSNTATPDVPTGIAATNFVKGMMVYDTTNKCLKIYDGTAWYCYTKQTCPD